MKHLIQSFVRSLGYEISKLPPPPSRAVSQFLNGPEAAFEPAGGKDTAPPVETDSSPAYLAGPARSLIVESWRFLPHSYAMVNQWQLLALARRPDISLKLLDAPLYEADWPREEGVFESQVEQQLKSLAMAQADEPADLMLRLFFPYDFSPSRAQRTA